MGSFTSYLNPKIFSDCLAYPHSLVSCWYSPRNTLPFEVPLTSNAFSSGRITGWSAFVMVDKYPSNAVVFIRRRSISIQPSGLLVSTTTELLWHHPSAITLLACVCAFQSILVKAECHVWLCPPIYVVGGSLGVLESG